MTKFLDKSFSSRAPNDNYRSGWDAIDWTKKSTAETLPAPPEPSPKTPFDPESDTVRHNKPPCAICRLPLDLCICIVPDAQETKREFPETD
jgi:hypothetical protein